MSQVILLARDKRYITLAEQRYARATSIIAGVLYLCNMALWLDWLPFRFERVLHNAATIAFYIHVGGVVILHARFTRQGRLRDDRNTLDRT